MRICTFGKAKGADSIFLTENQKTRLFITKSHENPMAAVVGTFNENSFLDELKESTEKFNCEIKAFFGELA